MKKLYTLAIALLASLAFTAPAHAFLIDGFGDNQTKIEATTDDPDLNGNGITDPAEVTPVDESIDTSNPLNVAVNDTDLTNALRQLTVTQEGSSDTTLDPDGGSVTAEVTGAGAGLYKYSQESLTFGTGTIDWTFSPESFSSPIAIALNLIEADNDLGTVTFTLTNAGGSFQQTLSLPEVDPSTDPTQTIIFNIGGFADGESFTSASLYINGKQASALDLTVDFIEVPAPGVLGLLGIGLAGLAFAGRRRRESEADA